MNILTKLFVGTLLSLGQVMAWISNSPYDIRSTSRSSSPSLSATRLYSKTTARKHGQDACFLPLKQLGQDYFAPRIIQIAGAYPGLTKQDLMAVTSEDAPELGQWTYDFSDPDGPQLGTVAIEGSQLVHDVVDPAVIIAEHFSIGITLPKVITEPVDLIVLVDRAEKGYAERKFMVLQVPGNEGVVIGAYPTKRDMPEGAEILGRVELVQVPWLPSMAPTKTGFMEADEVFWGRAIDNLYDNPFYGLITKYMVSADFPCLIKIPGELKRLIREKNLKSSGNNKSNQFYSNIQA